MSTRAPTFEWALLLNFNLSLIECSFILRIIWSDQVMGIIGAAGRRVRGISVVSEHMVNVI